MRSSQWVLLAVAICVVGSCMPLAAAQMGFGGPARGRLFDPFGASGFGGGMFDHGFGSRRHPSAFMPSRRHVREPPFHVDGAMRERHQLPPHRGSIFNDIFGNDHLGASHHTPFQGKAAPARTDDSLWAHQQEHALREREHALQQQRQLALEQQRAREAQAQAQAQAQAEVQAREQARAQAEQRAREEAEAAARAGAQPFAFEAGRQDGVEVRDDAYLLHVRPTPTRSGRAAPFDVRLADKGPHGRVVVSEALRGGFHRQYDLPADVRVRDVTARQGKGGVLTVTMPRVPQEEKQQHHHHQQQQEVAQQHHEEVRAETQRPSQPQATEARRADRTHPAAAAAHTPDAARPSTDRVHGATAHQQDHHEASDAQDGAARGRTDTDAAGRTLPRMRPLRSFAERQAHAADEEAAAKAEAAARMARERNEAERVAAARREELRQWRERRRAREAGAGTASGASSSGAAGGTRAQPERAAAAAEAEPSQVEELLQVFDDVLGAEDGEGEGEGELLLDVDREEDAGVSSGYYERGEFHPY